VVTESVRTNKQLDRRKDRTKT